MATLSEAFKRHVEETFPIAWKVMDPATKDVYSKAWRRGYAQARKDMIEEWSTAYAERDEVVRSDTDRARSSPGEV